MALKKLEYFIKPTSVTTIESAKTTILTTLNATQEATTNKLTETTYKDDFFAGLFDSRTNETYLVFSDVAKSKNGLTDNLMNTTPSASVDLSTYVTEDDLVDYATHAYVDEAIANIPSGTDTYVIG